MDSSTGYKGTARPFARSGFTARRGCHNSNARHSRQPKERIVLPSSDSYNSESEEDARLPTRRKGITASSADKENQQAVKEAPIQANVTSAKSLGKKADLQKPLTGKVQPPRPISYMESADEEVKQQQPTAVHKSNITIPTDALRIRLADDQSIFSPIDDMESEKKMMARSIIAGFPRRALESLLLDAAMGSSNVMREVIGWNTKNPITVQPDHFVEEPIPSSVQSEENSNSSVMAYAGLPAIRSVRPIPAPVAKTKPVQAPKPTKTSTPRVPSRVPSQESNIDKKIESLLKVAKRCRDKGEEYILPATEDRSKKRKTSPSPPPEPRTKLEQPLSFLTRDMTYIALIDIKAYVNRPTSERLLESEKNKVPGKVKRPMNSFMLYRKAYQHRAKEYGFMTTHKVVSQLCGDSWPLEPKELKEQFAEWARIERTKHEEAHPGYKFCPRPSRETSLLDELMD